MDLETEARVAELLHYPVAQLPDNVVAALSVWYLRQRGVLPRPEHEERKDG